MKTSSFLPAALFLTASLLFATGCPKKPEPKIATSTLVRPPLNEASVPPALAEPGTSQEVPVTRPAVSAVQDPIEEMSAALEAATPEKHEGLSDIQQRMDRHIDAQVVAWKAAGNNVSLADDEKLDTATEDFAEKLRLLTLSSPEVWETAKHNTELALQTVRAAYSGILAKPTRR
jgi:hypothetical protein